MTKSGYVAIVGKPNSGKSTLLNSILGTKLSIVTPKAQTTRKRVVGIYTEEDFQIIFLDTPGVLNPKYTMQKIMMDYVSQSVSEADIIIALIDVPKYLIDGIPKQILDMAQVANKPIIAALSKMDLLKDRKEILPIIAAINSLDIFTDIIPISAKKDVNIQELIKAIEKLLPNNEFYYDEDMLSIQNERFFVSEIIRESIFLLTKDEIPYSTEVAILEFKERENGKWFINAEIIVERDSQKRIIIGKDGSLVKEIGERSRKKIEMLLLEEVYLELFVKVRKNWRDDSNRLKSLGY